MMASIFLFLILFVGYSYQLNNGLGRTPQMGWNTWNHVHYNITEQFFRDAVDTLISSGLTTLGYEYMNLDDCWAGSRDAQGNIQADTRFFPSGIPALVDYVHSKNLKIGLYSDAGFKTCVGNRPGSLHYEIQDANTYAKWKIDYLKYDNCNNDGTKPEVRYPIMRDALNATGRPIFFSMCEWGVDQPALWSRDVGNSWRTTADLQDNWLSTLNTIDINNEYADKAGPFGWNDPDILNVGMGSMTGVEDLSNFCLWAISKAPLLIGGDVLHMTPATLSTVSNPEVIAVNQDLLGVQGKKVAFALSKLSNTSSNVIISNCSKSIDPKRLQWKYHDEDGSIRSVSNGQCLSIEKCSTSQTTNIIVSDCHINDTKAPCAGKNQQWIIGRSNQEISSQFNDLCLDLYRSIGPHVNTYSCGGHDGQAWVFDETDGTVRNKLNGQCLTIEPELEVWAGPLTNNSQAVLLFNRGNIGRESVTVQWSDIGFSVDQPAVVRDLLARKDIGTFTGSYTSPSIDYHAVMMLKVTPEK